MRCDRCPLSPPGSYEYDDVCCPISESDYGLEHSDGMWGCRHSWSWCKKRADEYLKHIEYENECYEKMIAEYGKGEE